jgi:Skp family chaperone for outer membrane proteins
MQPLENSGGLTDYGTFIALGLILVWVALLIALCMSKVKTAAFTAASCFLAFMVVFFWLWPTITEISIGKFGSIKTNVEQAKTYLNQMKDIQGQVKDIRDKIEQDAQAASHLQADAAKMRADFDKAQAETAHIKEQLAGREFTQDEHDRLVSLIRELPHSPTSKILFDSFVGNADAKRYGGLIAKALSDAVGMPIDGPPGLSTCGECTGVWVCVNENATAETSEDGRAIRKAFELAGVSGAKFCQDPRNGQGTPTTVKVLVGPKE